MKKTMLIVAVAVFAISCGPSDADLKKHEENRTKQEQQGDEEWDEMMDMLEDEDETQDSTGTVTE